MDVMIKGKNSKLINLSYITGAMTYLIGWYLITLGHIWAFIFAVPTLILGLNLIKIGERRYGLVLVLFFVVWLCIYYSYMPGQSLNL
jgi:hypothetical protein